MNRAKVEEALALHYPEWTYWQHMTPDEENTQYCEECDTQEDASLRHPENLWPCRTWTLLTEALEGDVA